MSEHSTPTDTAQQAPVEEWRPVVGFEGIYEVSSLGRIRRVGRAARTGRAYGGGARIGRIRKPQTVKGGYKVVALWRDGRQTMRLVHLIVAEAFLGPCPDGMEVNHKEGRNKWDNSVANLEYMTRTENMKHAYRTGLRTTTVEAAAAARRKPRVMVACECGCGQQIETPDAQGRPRRFVLGHSGGVRHVQRNEVV